MFLTPLFCSLLSKINQIPFTPSYLCSSTYNFICFANTLCRDVHPLLSIIQKLKLFPCSVLIMNALCRGLHPLLSIFHKTPFAVTLNFVNCSHFNFYFLPFLMMEIYVETPVHSITVSFYSSQPLTCEHLRKEATPLPSCSPKPPSFLPCSLEIANAVRWTCAPSFQYSSKLPLSTALLNPNIIHFVND